MVDKQRITEVTVDRRLRIPLSSLARWHDIKAGDKMEIIDGVNFTTIIVLPKDTKQNDRTMERIKYLVEDPLA